jgi:hypothetical protein
LVLVLILTRVLLACPGTLSALIRQLQVLLQVRWASTASTQARLVLPLLQVQVAPQVQAVLLVLLVRTMASPQVLQAQEVLVYP